MALNFYKKKFLEKNENRQKKYSIVQSKWKSMSQDEENVKNHTGKLVKTNKSEQFTCP